MEEYNNNKNCKNYSVYEKSLVNPQGSSISSQISKFNNNQHDIRFSQPNCSSNSEPIWNENSTEQVAALIENYGLNTNQRVNDVNQERMQQCNNFLTPNNKFAQQNPNSSLKNAQRVFETSETKFNVSENPKRQTWQYPNPLNSQELANNQSYHSFEFTDNNSYYFNGTNSKSDPQLSKDKIGVQIYDGMKTISNVKPNSISNNSINESFIRTYDGECSNKYRKLAVQPRDNALQSNWFSNDKNYFRAIYPNQSSKEVVYNNYTNDQKYAAYKETVGVDSSQYDSMNSLRPIYHGNEVSRHKNNFFHPYEVPSNSNNFQTGVKRKNDIGLLKGIKYADSINSENINKPNSSHQIQISCDQRLFHSPAIPDLETSTTKEIENSRYDGSMIPVKPNIYGKNQECFQTISERENNIVKETNNNLLHYKPFYSLKSTTNSRNLQISTGANYTQDQISRSFITHSVSPDKLQSSLTGQMTFKSTKIQERILTERIRPDEVGSVNKESEQILFKNFLDSNSFERRGTSSREVSQIPTDIIAAFAEEKASSQNSKASYMNTNDQSSNIQTASTYSKPFTYQTNFDNSEETLEYISNLDPWFLITGKKNSSPPKKKFSILEHMLNETWDCKNWKIKDKSDIIAVFAEEKASSQNSKASYLNTNDQSSNIQTASTYSKPFTYQTNFDNSEETLEYTSNLDPWFLITDKKNSSPPKKDFSILEHMLNGTWDCKNWKIKDKSSSPDVKNSEQDEEM